MDRNLLAGATQLQEKFHCNYNNKMQDPRKNRMGTDFRIEYQRKGGDSQWERMKKRATRRLSRGPERRKECPLPG